MPPLSAEPPATEPPVIEVSPFPQPSGAPDPLAPYRPILEAIRAAAVFLTRLPVPPPEPYTPELFGRAFGWFPLIGAGLGLAAGILYGLLGWFGVPVPVVAVLIVALLIGVTGALHEDGLADTADGLGGGGDRERKLDIMRDSRIGVYGCLALVLCVGLRIAVLASLSGTRAAIVALVVSATLSRAAMVVMSYRLPPARTDGLSATLGTPPRNALLIALGSAIGIAALFLGMKALPVLAIAAAATFGMMRLATHHVGGRTGDLVGATQQVVELAMLVLLVSGR
ncbi:MAG: adenosylcobinamide-GDP ribazoletransferase [Rhodospirillaceae bacterium]